jgi:hypothetical protein
LHASRKKGPRLSLDDPALVRSSYHADGQAHLSPQAGVVRAWTFFHDLKSPECIGSSGLIYV